MLVLDTSGTATTGIGWADYHDELTTTGDNVFAADAELWLNEDAADTNVYNDYAVQYGSTGTTTIATTWGNTCAYKVRASSAVTQWMRVSCERDNGRVRWRWKTDCAPYSYPAPISAQDRLREIIQQRQAPLILVSRKPVQTAQDIREIRARETLCRVLGEDKFQRFLKDGFVSVRAKSGLVYQIFPGHGITAVYRDGVQIERLCVVLRGDFPPTDSIIMRYLIILNDEARFRGYAIKHQVIIKPRETEVPAQRSLADIFRELKAKKVA